MKSGSPNPTKELYQKLRQLDWRTLWEEEVSRFDRADQAERLATVAVVRAVGVVFSESGDPTQKPAVAQWLRSLLRDPEEKVRRYAMAALPKIGATEEDEHGLLHLLETSTGEREKKFLGRALSKIGGAATLSAANSLPLPSRQKVQARVTRQAALSRVCLEAKLADGSGLIVHLRCRRGLEKIVRDEVLASPIVPQAFRVAQTSPGLVALLAERAFSLADLFSLRCFGTLSVVLAQSQSPRQADFLSEIARAITSPLAQKLFRLWTHGPPRYRLEFVGKGHQRGAVRQIAEQAFQLCPDILNDASEAPWSVDIVTTGQTHFIELRPRITPDPRFSYRRQDVPAASHPPLAACLARLAGPMENETVWDPFCGSGLELIERTRLGGVRHLFGSDRSSAAIAIASDNLAAAGLEVSTTLLSCDFRDFPQTAGLADGSLSLIMTNPPLGKRVPVPNLPDLIRDLFHLAEKLLRPRGRLVLANPHPTAARGIGLTLVSSRSVDFGGFDCDLQHYVKPARSGSFPQKPTSPYR